MVLHCVPGLAGGRGQHSLQLLLEICREGEVSHLTTRRANEVVMMAGEVLGELVPRVIAASHDSRDGAHLLQNGEVPVRTRLGE